MHYKKIGCLLGLLALTGCGHSVVTDEFVAPRFYLTLKPYSTDTWTVTLRPTEIKESNRKGTILKRDCVILENKIGLVRFECNGFYDKQWFNQLSYKIKEIPDDHPYKIAYPDVMVDVTTYERNPDGSLREAGYHAQYIQDEALELLKDHETTCIIKK